MHNIDYNETTTASITVGTKAGLVNGFMLLIPSAAQRLHWATDKKMKKVKASDPGTSFKINS